MNPTSITQQIKWMPTKDAVRDTMQGPTGISTARNRTTTGDKDALLLGQTCGGPYLTVDPKSNGPFVSLCFLLGKPGDLGEFSARAMQTCMGICIIMFVGSSNMF